MTRKVRVAGGLVGRLAWRWLSVDMLWIPEDLRGHGVGSAVLRATEKHAASRGYGWSRLESGIPSRSFYERNGYSIFAALDEYPPGGRQHYMRKTLVSH
ncbi:MAG: GNAT family N-acetyltransferase [Gemmatimonadaceae bacterium]